MKTITAYLTAAGITGDAVGPATTALQALLTDAQSELSTAQADTQREIRENQQARALAGAFRKVSDKAGVDLSALSDSSISTERRRELADTAAQQVLDFVGGAAGEAQDAARILADAGFDLDAYQKAGKEKRAEMARQFAEGVAGDRSRLRTLERDKALGELKLDAKKAGRILGNVVLVKEKVLTKDDKGEAKEVETWGVRNGDTFTTVEKLVTEAGWTMQELASRTDAGANASSNEESGSSFDWLLNAGQEQSNTQAGGVLDFLAPTNDAGTGTSQS